MLTKAAPEKIKFLRGTVTYSRSGRLSSYEIFTFSMWSTYLRDVADHVV